MYLIKLVACIWDKLFDLEDIEKPILNFVRFYTLSCSNCQNSFQWLSTGLRLLLHFREGNLNIDLNFRCSTSKVECAAACWAGSRIPPQIFTCQDEKTHFSKHHPGLCVLTTVKHWCSVTSVSWGEAAGKETHVNQHLIQKYTGNIK